MGDIRRLRSSAIWLVLIVAVIALWFLVVNDNDSTTNKDFSAVAADIQNGTVEKLTIGEDSNTVQGRVHRSRYQRRQSRSCPEIRRSMKRWKPMGSTFRLLHRSMWKRPVDGGPVGWERLASCCRHSSSSASSSS